MKTNYQEFKSNIPELTWTPEELADHLSAIGFETEVIGSALEVSLTANRRADCTSVSMIAFDLAAIYNLKVTNPPIIEPGVVIDVTLETVNKLLGTNIAPEDYRQIERLGFKVGDTSVICPSFRKDLETEADIAEEVIRLLGYDILNVKTLSQLGHKESPEYSEHFTIKQALVAAGLTEAITTTFTNGGQVELKNPINDKERFMRPTLEDGLLQVLAKNPFLKRAAFFEIGSIFTPEQETKVGIVIAGYKDIEKWHDNIISEIDCFIHFEPANPNKITSYSVKQGKVFYAEVKVSDFDTNFVNREERTAPNTTFGLPVIKEISKFPPLVRDFTISRTSQTPSSEEIIKLCQNSIPELLIAEVIDIYSVPDSEEWLVTLRFILQKMDSSFTDDEIATTSQKLEDLLKPYQKG